MLFVIVAVLTLLAALMVLMILAQDSKSGALNSGFGATQVMGVKRTADLLEKLTWSFMAAIMVITLSAKFFTGTGEDAEGPSSINVESAKSKPVATPQPQPQQPQQQVGPAGAAGTDSAAKP